MLVGGFGTRLRPLTDSTPKQMLPVVDRPMIEWVIGHLVDQGIDDVVLAMGYRPDVFRQRYPDGRCAGATLHYAAEPEPLGTAGAIGFAASDAGIDDTFVVVNGDVLTDLDIDGPDRIPSVDRRRGDDLAPRGRGSVVLRRGRHRRRRTGDVASSRSPRRARPRAT